MKKNNKDEISLIPEQYEKEEHASTGNYMSFTFFEHKDYIKKYVRKRKKSYKPEQRDIEYFEKIVFPLNRELFRQSYTLAYSDTALQYLPNLFYESIQKHGGSVNSIIQAMKENKTDQAIQEKTNIGNHTLGSFSLSSLSKSVGMVTGFGAAALLSQDNELLRGVKFAEGVAYNPNLRQIFRGEDQQPRFFTTSWIFYPKSEEEVKKIRRAEYIFNKNSLPSLWSGIGGFESKYINHFKYPKKVKIQIYIDGKPFEKHKFLDSVITNVSVIQNGDGGEKQTFIKNDQTETIFAQNISFNVHAFETKMFTRNDAEEVFSGVK